MIGGLYFYAGSWPQPDRPTYRVGADALPGAQGAGAWQLNRPGAEALFIYSSFDAALKRRSTGNPEASVDLRP